jgi:hypothetical protein
VLEDSSGLGPFGVLLRGFLALTRTLEVFEVFLVDLAEGFGT